MRYNLLVSLGLLVLCTLQPLHAATAPLTLMATANKDVLLARSLAGAAVEYRSVPPRYEVETAKVTLTFTNTGATPLKLNLFALMRSRLQWAISGPDGRTVIQQRIVKALLSPREEDFPVLPPGKSYALAQPLSFPDAESDFPDYRWYPGSYHVRFLYESLPIKTENKVENTLAEGSFLGAVSSNSLTFTLLEASDPVQGLQMALEAQPAADPLSGTVTLTAYLRNVSDKPFTINAWNLYDKGLQLSENGTTIPFDWGARELGYVTPAERYATLPPGEKHAFPLTGGYNPALDHLDSQLGNFSVMDKSGVFRIWRAEGSAVQAVALLEMPDAQAPTDAGAPGPLWAGKVTSPPVVIPLNPTAYRRAKLKQDLAHFALELNYQGPADKSLISLRLQTQPIKADVAPAESRVVRLSETEAAALIDALAKNGTLRAVSTPPITAAPGTPTGYEMFINGAPYNGKGEVAFWTLSLGWDLAMYQRMAALHTALPPAGQAALSTLLAGLGKMHERWLAEAALQQPITLDLPAGSLADAANAVIAATHCPSLKLSVDAGAGAGPIAALYFIGVDAGEACALLAEIANVQYTVSEGKVILQTVHAM